MSWHRYQTRLGALSFLSRLVLAWQILAGWRFTLSVNIHVEDGTVFMLDSAELMLEKEGGTR